MLDSHFLLPCSFFLFIRLGSSCYIVHACLIFAYQLVWKIELLVDFEVK